MGSNTLFCKFMLYILLCLSHTWTKKTTKKTPSRLYTRNKLKMVFCFTNAFWITQSPYLTDAPGLYCCLQSKLGFFKTGLHFCPVFVLPSRKVGRSRVFEWHCFVTNNGMHLLIPTVPLILSM